MLVRDRCSEALKLLRSVWEPLLRDPLCLLLTTELLGHVWAHPPAEVEARHAP